jgi:hypothetical protein
MQPERTIADVCRDIMLEIALAQPDPDDREAMLRVMRDDGWLA